jgi:hypothetical protein
MPLKQVEHAVGLPGVGLGQLRPAKLLAPLRLATADDVRFLATGEGEAHAATASASEKTTPFCAPHASI